MKNSIRFFVSIVLVFVFLFGSLPNANACGPFILAPIFSLETHADFPLIDFTNGKTGIVPASFGRNGLFVFYRQINNLKLTREEQKQIVNAMELQIFYRSRINDKSDSKSSGQETFSDPIEKWTAARAKVTNEKQDIETEKQIADGYYTFSNCLPGAFESAAKTLDDRIVKYGINENVKEWLKGQDTVFSNCESEKTLPAELGESSPDWLRRDRAYQIGAAQFYMGDFPAAREKFEKIAADEDSVWKSAAKFVAARTFIRQASLVEAPDEAQDKKDKQELLEKAADKLQNILADNSMNEFRASALRLLGLVKYRMLPSERQKELAEVLARPAENQNIFNDLTDYTLLLNYVVDQAETKGSEIDSQEAEKAGKEYDYNYALKLRDLPANQRENDLTDWLFTYQAADGFGHAFAKWKETGKLQWFVAAITKADAKSAERDELLTEAAKIQNGTPAFATVRYHQIRLLVEHGKRAEAKQNFDNAIANNLKTFPVSTRNKFLAQRMILAENLTEFLKYAPRNAAMFDWDETGREEGTSLKDDKYLAAWENRTMFDMDAVAFLNEKVPLSVLREAAISPQLPAHLKKFFVIAVWTRAFMTKNQAIEREFTPLMLRSAKEFTPLFAKYSSAANPINREAAALIAVLRYPVIQPFVPVGYGREDSSPTEIDSIRGNWWCTENEETKTDDKYDNYNFEYPSVYPEFLTTAQKTDAQREQQQIISFGDAPTFLTKRAVEFANKNPKHSQTPEILHLAVRSTRYGCTDAETVKLSNQAFDILHKSYPNSVWTKQTPYWFGQ